MTRKKWWTSFPVYLVFKLSTLSKLCCARQLNISVDDQNGDALTGDMPSYSPAGSWQQGSTCEGCLAKPDPTMAFDNTWHDATHGPGGTAQYAIQVSFTGIAVYAYFILANNVEWATTLTNLSFTLDGIQVGSFEHLPTTSTDYQYNVLGYSGVGLQNSKHQLTIQTTGQTNASLVLFDYLIYTSETDHTSGIVSSASPTTTTTASSETSSSDVTTTSGLIRSKVVPQTTSSLSLTSQESTISQQSITSLGVTNSHRTSPVENSTTTLNITGGPSTTSKHHSSPDNDVNTSPRRSQNIGAIVGVTIGGITGALALFAFFYWCWRRRASSHDKVQSVALSSQEMRESILDVSTPVVNQQQSYNTIPSQCNRDLNHYEGLSDIHAILANDYQVESRIDVDVIRPSGQAVHQTEETLTQESPAESSETVQPILKVSSPANVTEHAISNEAEQGVDEVELRTQIAMLQAEVVRLHIQQGHLQEIEFGDEPPPQYIAEDNLR